MGIAAREPSYSPSYAAAFDPSVGRYGGGGAVFEVVSATATAYNTAGTTHAITLGTHEAGDLLLVFFSSQGNTTSVGWNGGFTEIAEQLGSTIVDGAIGYKVAASASETLTITITTSRVASSIVYRITGHNAATNAPEAATATSGGPPNLTPSWGLANNLWFAMVAHDEVPGTDSAPTNYSNLQQSNRASASMSIAQRELSAASEDPGGFTFSPTHGTDWMATVAVQDGT